MTIVSSDKIIIVLFNMNDDESLDNWTNIYMLNSISPYGTIGTIVGKRAGKPLTCGVSDYRGFLWDFTKYIKRD